MHPISDNNHGTIIRMRVVPNAKRTQVDGIIGSQVKIRLHAPPVDGKANRELISFLAKILGIRKSAITLTSGESSRDKTILVSNINAQNTSNILMGNKNA